MSHPLRIAESSSRYPIVDRAVKDGSILDDPSFVAKLRITMHNILEEDRIAAGKSELVLYFLSRRLMTSMCCSAR